MKYNMAEMVAMVSVLHIALLPLLWLEVSAIDCYTCNSFNKSDPNCGDPFHPAYGVLVKECTQEKEGHYGSFRAKFCIKLIGNTVKDDIELVFRGCSLETLDSQCGDIEYEDVRYRGCLMSCTEDACNAASTLRHPVWTNVVIIGSLFISVLLFHFRVFDKV